MRTQANNLSVSGETPHRVGLVHLVNKLQQDLRADDTNLDTFTLCAVSRKMHGISASQP